MGKRFTDTDKWTKNKWFRKLPNEYKLFWLYILDQCDPVGVWEEDVEFAEIMLKCELNPDDILKVFNTQIKVINSGKKWWLINFCNFQYGELKEENINNRPHQSYISILKRHSLWIDYKKSFKRLKEKEQEKEEDKEKKKKYGAQKNVLLTDDEVGKLKNKFNSSYEEKLNVFSEGIAIKNYGYKNHYLAILKWNKDDKSDNEQQPAAHKFL